MHRTPIVHVLFAAALSTVTSGVLGQEAPPQADEPQLIAVLASDASAKEKADACRELARVGTDAAVPALAALLSDARLSHMARYALEPMPSPAVDKALRDAVGRLDGGTRIGVIGSIGARRDAGATSVLIPLLQAGDDGTVQAVARALGRIGTVEVAAALSSALGSVSTGNRLAVFEGLFRCAEALAGDGRVVDALGIYDRIRDRGGAPHQIRAAALRGTILIRGDDGMPLLLAALRGDDFTQVAAAVRTAIELPGVAVEKALAAELAKLPADKQILVASTLGKRRARSALPALTKLAGEGDAAARVAAIRALAEIGDIAAASVLVGLYGDAEEDVAQAAQDALGSLTGPEIDRALLNMLKQGDAEARAVAIDLIGQRRMVSALPELLSAAGQGDEATRLQCIKVLGGLAGQDEFQALIDLLLKATATEEIDAIESAMSAICVRETRAEAGSVVIRQATYGALPDGPSADVTEKVAAIVKGGSLLVEASNATFGDSAPKIVKKLRVEYAVNGTTYDVTVGENQTIRLMAGVPSKALTTMLLSALGRATGAPRVGLLRVLRSGRSPEALAAVCDALTDADGEVRNEAVSLLCGWPGADALPKVMQLAESATDARTKILALRGCFRLIPLQDVSASEAAAALGQVLALAERKEEKALGLSALAEMATPEALGAVDPYLGSPDLKEEASLAAAGIAEKILERCPMRVAESMERVLKATGNKGTAKRAESLLAEVRKREAGFESVFDGKTLNGWEGKTDFWSVEDGTIVGCTTAEKPTKGNTFLIWRGGTVADFELRLAYRIENHNSGIQYRSVDQGDSVVGGYQADIDETNRYTGILYEERGRGIIGPRGRKTVIGADGKREANGKTCNEKEFVASLKKDGWNDYVIIARGEHLVQKINGFTTVEVTDREEAKRRSEGILALQLHAGPPMRVQFRDIRIKHFEREP